ncbi:MAG: hypothetical protein HY675_11500 [Chloroflexi bacterium]|nr:hypothetical protein [Chloroflexota bacterium]
MGTAAKVFLGTAFLTALTLFFGAVAFAGTGDVLGTKHNPNPHPEGEGTGRSPHTVFAGSHIVVE